MAIVYTRNCSVPDASLPDVSALPRCAITLAQRLRELGYSSSGLRAVLREDGLAALDRHEPAAVAFACDRALQAAADENDRRLAWTVRLLILREPHPREVFVDIFGDSFVNAAISGGTLVCVQGPEPGLYRVAIDIRPLRASAIDHRDYLVFSDADASMVDHMPGTDHVLGVGAASLSLLQATGVSRVGSVLDLGTGCGVQMLGQLGRSCSVLATDVSSRAILFARATYAAAQVFSEVDTTADVEFVEGSWFEPVGARTFDRIVANPPFVVGPPALRHVYRDSGMDLDGATAKLVSEIPEHLSQGGHAFIVGAWVHSESEPWQARVASWFPDHGYRAWVLERDCVDPLHYVGTWIKDESLDPRSEAGQAQSRAWIEYLDDAGVSGIGFGFIAMTRIDSERPSEVVCEEFTQPYTDALGPEIEEYFRRCAWLDAHTSDEIMSSRFRVRSGLAVDKVSIARSDHGEEFTAETFADVVTRMTRTDGPRFSHDIDDRVLRIFRGLHPTGLSARDVCEIAELAEPSVSDEPLADQFLPVLVDAIRHGLVLPADFE